MKNSRAVVSANQHDLKNPLHACARANTGLNPAKTGRKWPISSEVRTWACPPAQAKNMLNLSHSCSVMMRAKFSHVLQYD